MRDIFSNSVELAEIAKILANYIRLPVSQDAIPGAFLEGVLAHVRQAERLNTYDYIDVFDRTNRIGWSIKSTKEATPVTWKRAKLPNQVQLISNSNEGEEGIQALGDSIIEFCNAHAIESMRKYDLIQIGYARLIMKNNGEVVYFERLLSTRDAPEIFEKTDFSWSWSKPKNTTKKEQLPALHGFHKPSGSKWWAWHGLGENQLHFSGEGAWWPSSYDDHAIAFKLPEDRDRISFEVLADLLEDL